MSGGVGALTGVIPSGPPDPASVGFAVAFTPCLLFTETVRNTG